MDKLTLSKIKSQRNAAIFLIAFAVVLITKQLYSIELTAMNTNHYIATIGLLIVLSCGCYGLRRSLKKLKSLA